MEFLAFTILVLGLIRALTRYEIKAASLSKLAMIVTVAAQINLIMLGSEIFIEFYEPTSHSLSAKYLFFGLHGHHALRPWIWTSLAVNILCTVVLTMHPLRNRTYILYPACVLLFVAIWVEKGPTTAFSRNLTLVTPTTRRSNSAERSTRKSRGLSELATSIR